MEEFEKIEMTKIRTFSNNFFHKQFDWLVETNGFDLIVWYFQVISYVSKNISNRERKIEKVKNSQKSSWEWVN